MKSNRAFNCAWPDLAHDFRVAGGADDEMPEDANRKPGLWRRFVIDPILGQLKQGISVEKLAWSIGAGMTIGICPVWGTRAWICLLVGWLFKLNQPALHTFKSLLYPLQIVLMIPFIQMGQVVFGDPPLEISVEFLKSEFSRGFWVFLGRFGWLISKAAVAWLLVSPAMLFLLKWSLTPVLRKAGSKFRKSKEATV